MSVYIKDMKMPKNCSSCKHFNYDEIWNGDEEIEIFQCGKDHFEHIGWNTESCEDYEEDE